MRNQTIFLSAGILAALALTGCNTSQPSTPPTASTSTTINTPPASSTTTTTANGMSATTTTTPQGTKINNNAGPGSSNGTDQATADAVNAAIVRNKEMTGSRVDAVVTAGVARLTGTVQNQQQKALAATTASKVSGVTNVDNKLMIDATGGIHSSPPPTKVIEKTKIINHYVTTPPSGDNAPAGGDSSSATSPSGASASSASGGNSTATTTPPAGNNGGNGGNTGNGNP